MIFIFACSPKLLLRFSVMSLNHLSGSDENTSDEYNRSDWWNQPSIVRRKGRICNPNA